MASRAVLMKTGLRPLNTVRPVNTAHPKTTVYSARPMSCFSKSAQSTFWHTATVRTVDNGEQEITATVDDKEFTVTKASVRRHLQLAYADGISVLQNTKNFDQLSLMGMKKGFFGEHTPLFPNMLAIQAEEGEGSGHPSEPQPPPSTAQPTNEQPIPNVVSSSHQKTQTPRQALNKVPRSNGGSIDQTRSERVPTPYYDSPLLGVHTPRSDEERFKQHELTGNVLQQSNDPPLSRGHTLRSGEDSIELIKELMETYTKLSKRVLALKESKTAQDLVITGLKLRVTKLEKKKKKRARTPQPLKRRLFKVRIESSAKENLDKEDPSEQGRSFYKVQVSPTQVSAHGEAHSQEAQPEDQLGVLSTANVLVDVARKNVQTYTRRRRRAVSTSSGGISTASRLFSTAEESVSTAGASMPVSTTGIVQEVNISIPSPVAVKDKGKGKMEEFEDEQTKRTKLQQEQDRLGHEADVRLQEELDEKERQKMARVHEATQSFTKEEWENIRARVEDDKELAQRLQEEERNKYSKVDQAKILKLEVLRELQKQNLIMKVLRGKRLMKLQVEEVYVEALQVKYLIIDWEVYTEESRKYWKIIRVERFSSTKPTDDKERTLWVELKRLFEPYTDDTLWKLQRERISIVKRGFDFDVG
nr:hypothetical protein [Tanacetum cinerariifolium]